MAKSFSQQIQEFSENTGQSIDRVVKDFCFGLTTSIQEKTPIGNPSLWKSDAPSGYVGGTARSNWIPSVGQPDTSTTDTIDLNSAQTKFRAIQEKIPGNIYYLTNSVPYIERLEYGWSTQAPQGMVRTSIRAARKHLADAVRKNTRR